MIFLGMKSYWMLISGYSAPLLSRCYHICSLYHTKLHCLQQSPIHLSIVNNLLKKSPRTESEHRKSIISFTPKKEEKKPLNLSYQSKKPFF